MEFKQQFGVLKTIFKNVRNQYFKLIIPKIITLMHNRYLKCLNTTNEHDFTTALISSHDSSWIPKNSQ